jgi:hypothetical protein
LEGWNVRKPSSYSKPISKKCGKGRLKGIDDDGLQSILADFFIKFICASQNVYKLSSQDLGDERDFELSDL